MGRTGRVMALAATATLLTAGGAATQVVQERVDLAAIEKIREEGLERSHIDQLARHLTDVIGPRLTGSSNMFKANEWTAEKFREWNLANVTVEAWGEFGRGWENISYSGRILDPYARILHAHPMAWTGSTEGTLTGEVTIVVADSIDDLDAYRGKLRDAIVLLGTPAVMAPEFVPNPLRRPLEGLVAANDPNVRQRGDFERRRAFRAARNSLWIEEGVAAVLHP